MSKDILRYNGFELDLSGDRLVDLNLLWQMSQASETQSPRRWVALPETKRLVEQISKELNVEKSVILKSKRGKGGGTLAHYKLAIEYAGYLSVELRSLFLGWIKERIEEESNPELSVSRGRERAIAQWRRQGKSEDWIDTRLKGIEDRHSYTDSLKKHGVSKGYEFAGCTNAIYEPILGGTAKEVKEKRNLPAKRSIRDGISRAELAALQLAEIVVSDRMDKEDSQGFKECKSVAERTSKAIAQAIA